MSLFGERKPEMVTNGRFEIERDGKIAYLEYTLDHNVLGLIHTEVPESLRGGGIASLLAKSALDWARENHVRVDIVCPIAAGYVKKHPEYSDLILN